MDTNSLIVLLLIALDVGLWVGATVVSLSTTNRFRVYSSAFVVLCIILAVFFGWQNAAMISFAGLWAAAILSNVLGTTARMA